MVFPTLRYRFPRTITQYITLTVETTASCFFASLLMMLSLLPPGSLRHLGQGLSKQISHRFWYHFRSCFSPKCCFTPAYEFFEHHRTICSSYQKSTNLISVHTAYFMAWKRAAASNQSRCTCKSTKTSIGFNVPVSSSIVCLKYLNEFHMYLILMYIDVNRLIVARLSVSGTKLLLPLEQETNNSLICISKITVGIVSGALI